MKEQVLAVPTTALALPAENYITDNEMNRIICVCAKHHRFIDRDQAEADPGYRQLIPYVTICKGTDILTLERTRAQSEKRLHGKLSIGVGGHINPQDQRDDLHKTIEAGRDRELVEELWIKPPFTARLSGLINDDSNAVGAVHLGLHYIFSTDQAPKVRETEKMRALWLSGTQLAREANRLETWSRIALPFLAKDGQR
ncbi:MAG: hypothetical protein FH749_15510 [Firmicutes bacterium]|nr:hypothetical protein [Bacillota bacterium]